MLQLSWQSLWARRRRLASTAVAVVLGVAFLVGTIVLGDTIAANFDDLFSETAAGTDVVVRGESPLESSFEADAGRRPVDTSLVDQLAAIDGVDVAEPQVVGYGQLLGADGDPIGGNGPPRQAGSWITTPDLNPYQLDEGRAPDVPDEVVVNRGAMDDGGLSLGDRTVVQLPDPVEVTIVGISTFGDADGFGDTTMTAFTFDAAQERIMRQPGTVSSIVVKATDGQDADELRARVDEVLPDGVEAVTGAEIVDERLDSLDFLGMIRAALVAFAVIALLVAALSINNTFSITVAQRTQELALLRSIGASSRQVRRLVRLEAVIVGVVAALVGVVAGIGVAALLKALFAGFGLALPTGGLTVERPAAIIGVVVGVAATLLAARAPARRASRVAPIEALRASTGEDTAISRRRRATAIAVLAVGAVLAVAGAAGAIALVGLGALVLVAGTLLIAPILVPSFVRACGAVLRRTRGLNGALAEQNASRQPRRTSRTATALFIGVAVVTMFTVFAASLASSVESDTSDGFGNADLSITTPVFGGGVLSPEVMDDVDRVPEIDEAAGVSRATVVIDGEETQVAATDMARAGDILDVSARDGSLSDVGPGEAVISETRAEDEGWAVGSTIDVTYLDDSTQQMTVGAVIDDNDVLAGIVIPISTWFDRAPQPSYTSVFMTLADGVDLDKGRAAITDIASRYTGDVQDRDGFSDAASAGLDMLLGLVYAMLALAILISLLGIANTLSMAVHERRHEIGVLRAVGQTRRQTRSVLRLESAIVATFGTTLGLLVGTVLGSLLYTAIAEGDGSVVVPWTSLVVILVAGMAAGVLAAWRPARRAARLDILDAIATT
ncbi:MAG: ABC transporter permease [Acidimicrobiales bacterium]